MIFLLYVLHLILQSFSKASPLSAISIPGEWDASRTLSNAAQDTPTCQHIRSEWDIIWSCLVTIFACSWVSIHPNIPNADESWFKIAMRRVGVMLCFVTAPEIIIMWAMRQWYGARLLQEKYKAYGWTMAHGHFLQMGGFMLYESDGDKPTRVLLHDEFAELLDKKRIKMPRTSRMDIFDRSKADALSKTIVILQTGWFIAHCAARGVQGLVVTQFELITLSFAALNGFMYFLWWDKPLDVCTTVEVHLSNTPSDKPKDGVPEIHDVRFVSSPIEAATQILGNTAARSPGESKEIEGQGLRLPEIETEKEDPTFPAESKRPDNHRLNTPDKIKACQDSNSPHLYLLATWNLLNTTARTLNKFLSEWPLLFGWGLYPRLIDMSVFAEKIIKRGQMRVGSFYALHDDDSDWESQELKTVSITASIGIIFGAIHCIGWSFNFPTQTQQVMWRICSVIIIGVAIAGFLIPPVGMLYMFCANKLDIAEGGRKFKFLTKMANMCLIIGFFILPPMYVGARIVLMIEAFIALHHIPTRAFAEVEWLLFIPHI